jgi:hypothetical protein
LYILFNKEWVSKSIFDPNDPRNNELLAVKQLISNVCGADESNLNHILLQWAQTPFFRIGLPKWLHRATLGVGPIDIEPYQKRFDILSKRFKKQIVVAGAVPLHVTDGTSDLFVPRNSIRDETVIFE